MGADVDVMEGHAQGRGRSTMVRMELSDAGLMLLGGVGSLASGAHALVAPTNYEDLYYGPKTLHPIRANAPQELVRWNGLTMAAMGALTLAARDHLTPTGTRRWFQTSGAAYGVGAAMTASNAYRGRERKGAGYVKAAVLGSLGALKLWRGFKKHNSTIKV
ncbi:hypothetical protein HYH03_002084 [Edaphochlamys debaryana]|uniref:Uncharacterized protein n=1 Tax=Edaphochlamys debaryana TaxID=47281 RepID=A0A835YBD5_9CHLO|nr:hypothetical protein HYH03_002084 [Edaphochlamys debaryana]|eukprot:KAG2499787.1 hypothetical protein HYH03_002084 [Edaphochlamys debaryana]